VCVFTVLLCCSIESALHTIYHASIKSLFCMRVDEPLLSSAHISLFLACLLASQMERMHVQKALCLCLMC